MAARLPMTLAAGALCAVAVGCGSAKTSNSAKKFSGDKRAVATTIENLESDANKRQKLCDDVLSTSFVRAVETHAKNSSCPAALRKSLRDVDSSTYNLTVKTVSIQGTKATASVASEVAGEKDRIQSFSLVKEGRSWKISAVGA